MSVTERVRAARDEVRRAREALNRYAAAREKAAKNKRKQSGDYDRDLLERAVEMVRPKIIRYLLANYDRSGLRTETGRLRSAIANSDVGLGGSARRPYIAISFPSGLPDDKKTHDHKKKSVYVYGASLNFGAVYVRRVNRVVRDYPTGKMYTAVRPILGQKAKKSLKKGALEGRYSHKIDTHLAKFGINAREHNFTDMGKTLVNAHARIVKPKRYYRLTPPQQTDVLKDVAAYYQRLKAQAAARN